jgi:hypothetical protein
VFAGMLGVTAFGLLLTPVFYVLVRRLTARLGAARATTPQPAGAPLAPLPAPEGSHD